jgi:AhpD family alkylhydroperoxidase
MPRFRGHDTQDFDQRQSRALPLSLSTDVSASTHACFGAREMTDWPEMTKELSPRLRDLRQTMPEVMKAFAAISQAALAPKALDTKTKELIALAIAVALRCDDCIAFHVKSALQQGASREEVTEALGMAIYMGAGPSVMYASHALDAYEQFGEAAKPGSCAA